MVSGKNGTGIDGTGKNGTGDNGTIRTVGKKDAFFNIRVWVWTNLKSVCHFYLFFHLCHYYLYHFYLKSGLL